MSLFVILQRITSYFPYVQNNRDESGDGGGGRYGASFHATKETVESGQTDMGHAAEGTGGAVPD